LVGKRTTLLQLLEIGAPAQAFQSATGGRFESPGMYAGPALRLLGFALLGGSPDSVRALESRIETLLTASAGRRESAALRHALLATPAELGFPLYGARPIHDDPGGDYLLRLQALYARGDYGGLRQALGDLARNRRGPPPVNPGEVGLESLYQETWLQVAAGDTAGAVRALDTALEALPFQRGSSFRVIQGPASLVLGMALRARLAARQGDGAVARRWAAAVVALWGEADEGVPVDMSDMKRMMQTGRE
jgi:hypothetical protein